MAPPDEQTSRALRLLALLCVLALGGYLRLTTMAQVEDLRPWPDALEYEEAARSLHEGRGYLLWIAGDAYPPRYPPGLSLLIAAALPLAGTQLGAGIWVVLASALAAIGGTYALARAASGFAAGIVAALLVATSPLHVQWSRAVMSDVPASAAVAWLALWLLAALRRRAGAGELFALGIACGAAASIRQAVLALVPAAVLVLLLFASGGPRVRWRAAAALAAGALLGTLPLLWLNARLFGGPLRGGYDYWVSGELFSLSRVLGPLPSGAPGNAWYYGALLLGDGALYPWTAAILLLVGTLVAARRPGSTRALAALAWLVAGIVLALQLAFVWQWDRFLLPILPLLAALMALPCARGARPALRAAGFVLLAATLLLESRRPEAFRPHKALGTRNEIVFVAACPTAHTLACLRFAAGVAAPVARLATGLSGLTPGRAGFAPAGRQTEFHRVIASSTPFRPAVPGRTMRATRSSSAVSGHDSFATVARAT